MDAVKTNPHHDRCPACVHAWAELSRGEYALHAKWDDSHVAHETEGTRNPAIVAAKRRAAEFEAVNLARASRGN
jgi:hypothetical protein